MWTPDIEDDDSRALRWLLAETVSVFVLNAVAAASEVIRVAPDLLATEVGDRLSAGLAPADVMRRIALDVDKFVGGVLAAAKAPASLSAEAMGALHPAAPAWTEQFLELLSRIAAMPQEARRLPRQADLLTYERIVWRREILPIPYGRLSLSDSDTGRLTRLIAAFLRSQAEDIEVVDRALTTKVRPAGHVDPPEASNDDSDLDTPSPVQASLLES